MKLLTPTLTLMLLASSIVWAQPPVVGKASKLLWDDPNPAGAVTQFRIYAAGAPGVVPDGVGFVAEVPAATTLPGQTYEWTIDSPIGSHWAVVTAVNDDGVSQIVETAPSNEVHYVVIGPPTNPRIQR
jgi:hypothetical protein